MKILITFAIDNEFAPWRAMRAFHPARSGCANVQVAEFGGTEVAVLLTGVGVSHARRGVAEISSGTCGPIDFIISSGLAGGLRREYEIGQVLAARSVFANGANGPMPSSAHLMALASECGATLVDGFFSADHVVTASNEKRALGDLASAVEMESFEVLRRAAEIGVPAIAVRAISDVSEEDLPIDTNRIFSANGEISITRVLGEVARRPQSIPGLVRFGRQCRVAAGSLAHFLDSYVQKLAGMVSPMETEAVVMRG